MIDLQDRTVLQFRPGARRITTARFAVDPLTSGISLRLRRPTTALPFAWDDASTLRVTIAYRLDGVEYACVGQVTGGVRVSSRTGNDQGLYELSYGTPLIAPVGAPILRADGLPWRSVELDGPDRFVRTKRMGEYAQSEIQAYLIFEQLGGSDIDTELLIARTREDAAPLSPFHQSVSFDAATSAEELLGDGVLSLTHTATGSDRGAFAGVAYSGAGLRSTSVTYAGNAMTEEWDITYATYWMNAGYRLAGANVTTGAQTVTSTIADGAPDDHFLGVVSMTGVDATTPVGTAFTASGTASPTTVTVTGVGTDDLVVDNCLIANATGITIGADQTETWTAQDNGENHFRGSRQLGSVGASAVMSWSHDGATTWAIGAIAFKPAAAGGDTLMAQICL